MINNKELIKPLLDFPHKDCFYFIQVLQRKKDHKGERLGGSNNNSRLIPWRQTLNKTIMKTLLICLLFVSSSLSPSCLNMDLILIGDLSASVSGNEKFVGEAFLAFIDNNEIDENFQVGIITFNDIPTIVNDLSSDKEKLHRNALSLLTANASYGTKLTPALNQALDQFYHAGSINHKKMIIIVSDGAIDDKYETSLTILRLRRLGVNICGILINDSASNPNFFTTSCGECYVESNYETLVDELKKLNLCM